MKLNSSDLISRSTQVSSRNLVIAASAVLIVEFYDLDPKKWNILNGDVTPQVFESAALLSLSFLLASLIVHWSADYVFYRKWFKLNEVTIHTGRNNSSISSDETVLAALTRRLAVLRDTVNKLEYYDRKFGKIQPDEAQFKDIEHLNAMISEVHKHSKNINDQINRIGRDVEPVLDLLDNLQPRFRNVDALAKFVVFGWYLTLPVSLAVVALFVLYSAK